MKTSGISTYRRNESIGYIDEIRISVHALVAPEEKRDGAGAGVASNGGAYVIDVDFAVELGKTLLYYAGHSLGIFNACRLRDETFTVIVKAVLRMLFHALLDLFDDTLLGANFLARDKAPQVVKEKQPVRTAEGLD